MASPSTKRPTPRVVYIAHKKKNSTPEYVLYALQQQCEVLFLDERQVFRVEPAVHEIVKFKPDFVLFHKGKTFGPLDLILEELKDHKILTVSWVFDLYFNLPPNVGTRTVADHNFKADLVFVTDGGNTSAFKRYGVDVKVLRQGIHAPEHKQLRGLEKKVIFIGTIYSEERYKLVRFLHRRYRNRFELYGRYSMTFGEYDERKEMKEVRGLAFNEAVANAVVVGDSVRSPHYWSNRVYEVTGRGGFLLHPADSGVDEEFVPYKEFVPYQRGNTSQLAEIIDYYLEHDAEREAIRDAGFKKCGQYTYEARVRELLKICNSHYKKSK